MLPHLQVLVRRPNSCSEEYKWKWHNLRSFVWSESMKATNGLKESKLYETIDGWVQLTCQLQRKSRLPPRNCVHHEPFEINRFPRVLDNDKQRIRLWVASPGPGEEYRSSEQRRTSKAMGTAERGELELTVITHGIFINRWDLNRRVQGPFKLDWIITELVKCVTMAIAFALMSWKRIVTLVYLIAPAFELDGLLPKWSRKRFHHGKQCNCFTCCNSVQCRALGEGWVQIDESVRIVCTIS
jgi:hypothetical protein